MTSKESQASDLQFRRLVASVRDYAIFMLTPAGHVATWNAGAERIKGYRADEIIGRHFSTFYPEEDIRAGKCEYELEVAGREGRFEDEGWRVRKDGTKFWANVVISAVVDDAGTLVGFSKVTRDLTDRKRAEDDRAARIAAEAANRAKDEFLAMLGHELRNPLAPISTALQLMKLRAGGQLSNEQLVIERQLKHVMRLVDDLLDVSRIVRRKVTLKTHPLDLRDVIARAVEVASPLIEQRSHHLDIDSAGNAFGVDGDDERLVQVFSNLIMNAAKYTEPGGHLGVFMWEEAEHVVVEVRDDGIGLEPDLLPRVFDLFVQGNQGAERAAGGLGLGLALVRSLVELHKGSVEARSAGPGRGSRFVVRLPKVALATAAERRPARHASVSPSRRILIVDDNEDALMLLAEALAAEGHEIETAPDPLAALAVAGRFRPEIAILDIGLPVMDGYELAERLRADLPDLKLKLIALTGYGQPSDRERSARGGFDVHFVKPVDLDSLSATIARA